MAGSECEHTPVMIGQPHIDGKNRYRLDCGHWFDCTNSHPVYSIIRCYYSGRNEPVVFAAIQKAEQDA